MKRITWVLYQTAIVLLLLVITAHFTFAAVVKRVHDGDTFMLDDGTAIRILDIDAPELLQKPFGKDSGAFLRALIKGKNVTLTFQVDNKGNVVKDVYGKRFLARVHYAGVDIGLLMVKEGMAFVYRTCTKPEYLGAQEAAKRDKKGFWGAAQPPMDPYLFRKTIRQTYGAK